MSKAINQTIWNSINAYLGVGLGAINTLILYPWAFKDNPEYMGLVNLLLSYALVVSIFGQLGAPNMIIRYYSAYTEKGKHQLYAFGMLLPLVSISLVSIALYFYKDNILGWLTDEPLVYEYGFLLIPLIGLNIYFEVFASISQSNIRTIFPFFLREVARRLMATVLLVIYFFGVIDFWGFMIWFTIGYLIQFLALFAFLIKNNFLKLEWKFNLLDKKKLIDYGLFIFLIAGGNLLIGRVDMIMIGKLAPDALVDVAKYSIAFFMSSVINMPNKSIIAVAAPLLSKAWEDNDHLKIARIYASSCLNQFIFAGIIFLLIWINVHDFFSLLPEKFRGGEMAFLFLGIARVLRMSTGTNSIIIAASNYYRYNLLFNGTLIITAVLLNIWLIPIYGLNGAAMATLLSFVLNDVMKVGFIWIKMGLQPYDKKTLVTLVLLLAILAIGYLLPSVGNAFINIMYKSILLGPLYLVVIYKLKLSDEVNGIINTFAAKLNLWNRTK